MLHMGRAVEECGAGTPRKRNPIRPAVSLYKEGAGGGSNAANQTDTNFSQPPMVLHKGGAVGGSGDSTQTNLSQPSVLHNTKGTGAGWGGTAPTNTDLSQPPVLQHTERAVKELGDATQIDTNPSQPLVIQHMGGDGGGRVVRTRRNTNLFQPAVLQCKGGSTGGRGAPAAVVQPPVLTKSSSGGSRDGGGFSGASGVGAAGKKGAVSSQKASSVLSSANPADDYRDEQQRLSDWVAEDMATWESSGQWIFSCYSPEKGKPNVSDFPEISPEELRLGYYTCSAKEGTGLYINAVHQYVQQWRNRLQELKALNAWRTALMLLWREKVVTPPSPSLGLGGQ
ncbi:nucleoporin NUP42-like [Lagopus leucura]|uniref:nucleoporin NUP42-like n=1 Tax=Lagopus leucura TaxID=30410 RepID=UPI001C66AF74|nr:nucleoporin NUP42-like [Lagopus leucura]